MLLPLQTHVTMALYSDQLVWELVKGHNAFVSKNLHNRWFSNEANNITGEHSYKYSGELLPPAPFLMLPHVSIASART